MRLIVLDERSAFDQQTHAYAEYKAFSTMAGHDADVAEITVMLARPARDDDGRGDGGVVCAMTVRMTSGEFEQARAVARHAYAAIDEAVSLIRQRPSLAGGTPGRIQSATSH